MFGFRKRKRKLMYKIESVRIYKNSDLFEYAPIDQAFPRLYALCNGRCDLRIISADHVIPTEATIEFVGEQKVIYEVVNEFYIKYGQHFSISEAERWR